MEPFAASRGLSTLSAVALLLLFSGSGALALDGPKVVVTYSLERVEPGDGRAFVQNITDTVLGLGDVRFVMDIDYDEQPNANVFVDSPQWVEIEYTADDVTEEIVSGPVEITDSYMEQEFEVIALGGGATAHTDQVLSLAREGVGTFDSVTGLITFDNETPYQQSNVGITTCSGEPFLCDLAAPPGGWPRIEDGTPKDVFLPLFNVWTNAVLGDAISSDNDTPGNELDDILASSDSQATTYNTWHGVEISRTYVPEPGFLLSLGCGATALLALARLRRGGHA